MKKILVLGSMVLAVLGIVAVAQAAAPTVSAGASQTITLPTNTATLSGSATFSSPATAIATYAWTFTGGPVTPVIVSPSSVTTSVTGLTSPGVYNFKLVATDNATPTAFSADTSTSITVNMNQNPLPVINNTKMKLEINPRGQVNLQGTIDSINGNNLVVKVWGLTFNVNTTNAKFGSLAQDVSLYKAGDWVEVKGMMDPTASSPTINARKVSNTNIRNMGDRKDREDDWKDNGKMDGSFKGMMKDFFGGDRENGKGEGRGKGRDGDR
jgi:hypothetical protein